MGVENENQIDGARLHLEENQVELHLMHSLQWNDQTLILLQNKVNTYLKFIESEEIYEGRDSWRGFDTVVILNTLYKISIDGHDFINASKKVFEQVGATLVLKEHT